MAHNLDIFLNELYKLLGDYKRCRDQQLKEEISSDIELLISVIFDDLNFPSAFEELALSDRQK